jgi:hypothetical protein
MMAQESAKSALLLYMPEKQFSCQPAVLDIGLAVTVE